MVLGSGWFQGERKSHDSSELPKQKKSVKLSWEKKPKAVVDVALVVLGVAGCN